jgi:hypothetical protein
MATAGDERRKKRLFCPRGQRTIEKAHFRQGNPRKSKPFSLMDFARRWPGFARFG